MEYGDFGTCMQWVLSMILVCEEIYNSELTMILVCEEIYDTKLVWSTHYVFQGTELVLGVRANTAMLPFRKKNKHTDMHVIKMDLYRNQGVKSRQCWIMLEEKKRTFCNLLQAYTGSEALPWSYMAPGKRSSKSHVFLDMSKHPDHIFWYSHSILRAHV